MRQEVEEGEQDRARLLDAQDAKERPFAMVLDHWIQHRGVSGDSLVGYDVLTCVVTVGGTRPEKEPEVYG